MSGTVYRPYRSADEPGLRVLFEAVYGPKALQRTSAWRYLAPAPWPALIQIAEADGRVVGAQPSHGVDLRVAGEPVKGLLLLDVMTHPDYRRRGIFAGVVEGLRERAMHEGYRVLLTTPNRDAARGFARLPAWTRMGELVPWVSIGDLVSLLTAARRGDGALPPIRFPSRPLAGDAGAEGGDATTGYPGDGFTAALWRLIADASPCQVVREPRFVSWRFGSGSGRPYSIVAAGTAEAPEALLVIGRGRFFGRDVLTLVDVMITSSHAESGSRLMGSLAEHARREHLAAVVGWFAPRSRTEPALRAAGFMRVPGVLRPRPYEVWAASDLAGEARRSALDLHAWSMSLADSDLA